MEGKRLNATLTFGMVVIPVGVVPVLDSTDRVSFKRLHGLKKDGSPCETPIKQQNRCPQCDVDVESTEIVSGFEVSKGQFLVISDEEKASVAANRSPMIEISKFVSGGSVNLMDAVRLGSDKSYWLPPQNEHVAHPYSVLAHGMRAKGVIAVAKATVWSRQWPVCIEVIGGMLALTQLHPLSAIRSGGLELDEVSTSESRMAQAVIEDFTDSLEPSDLVSDADDALKNLVTAKMAGKKFTAPVVKELEPTMNIMDALKASLASAKGKPPVKKTAKVKVKA